jgi:membrane-associated protease RseP (regulator of RpoE activity)
MQSQVVIKRQGLFASAGLALVALLLAACSGSSQSAAPSEPAGTAASTGASAAAVAASTSASPAASGSASASASASAGNGQLGMIFEVNNSGWQKLLGAPAKKGMVVVFVVPNQPGAKAGIQVGDVVTNINNVPTMNANAANLQIRKLKVDDKVPLTVERKSGTAKVDLTVGAAQQFNLPQMLDDQVKKNDKDARAYFLRGAYGQTDVKARGDDYTKAIQLSPDLVSAFVERGTLAQKSNPDQAMKDFNQAATLDPSYEPLYVNRSVLFAAQKA